MNPRIALVAAVVALGGSAAALAAPPTTAERAMPGETVGDRAAGTPEASRSVNGTLDATGDALAIPNAGAAARVGRPSPDGGTTGLTGDLPDDAPGDRAKPGSAAGATPAKD